MHGNYGVSEVGTGAGERVDGIVNGAGLALESIVGLGANGDDRIMGGQTGVKNEFIE